MYKTDIREDFKKILLRRGNIFPYFLHYCCYFGLDLDFYTQAKKKLKYLFTLRYRISFIRILPELTENNNEMLKDTFKCFIWSRP